MLDREMIEEQLKASYQALDRIYGQRDSIKKWALTIWAAMLVSFLSGKIVMNLCEAQMSIIIILVIFWLYEGMTASYGRFLNKLAKKQEQILLSNNFDSQNPDEYMQYQSRKHITLKAKFKVYLYSIFCMETVWIFYLMLSILGVLVLNLKFN